MLKQHHTHDEMLWFMQKYNMYEMLLIISF